MEIRKCLYLTKVDVADCIRLRNIVGEELNSVAELNIMNCQSFDPYIWNEFYNSICSSVTELNISKLGMGSIEINSNAQCSSLQITMLGIGSQPSELSAVLCYHLEVIH